MLVLTRKVNQTIIIDERIRVTLLEIEGDKIKLGIEAPREILIIREELYQAVVKENKEASSLTPADMSQMGDLPEPAASRQIKGKD